MEFPEEWVGVVKAVFFELDTRNVHHKRNLIITSVVVMETPLAPDPFCHKPNVLIFNSLK